MLSSWYEQMLGQQSIWQVYFQGIWNHSGLPQQQMCKLRQHQKNDFILKVCSPFPYMIHTLRQYRPFTNYNYYLFISRVVNHHINTFCLFVNIKKYKISKIFLHQTYDFNFKFQRIHKLIQIINFNLKQYQLYLQMLQNRYTAPISNQIQQQKGKSCFTALGSTLKKFNPCLRPQRQSQTLAKFLSEFKQVSLYEDPYFGQVFLLESLTHNQQVLLKKQKLSPNDAKERQDEIKQIQSFSSNQHVVSQVLIEKVNKVSFLWEKVELYLVYDFIVFDLHKQFEYRISKGTKFTDKQISSIIRGSCKGLIPLQPTAYSSIRLSHIYLTRKGTLKIAHPSLFHYKSNLEQICQHTQAKGIYLSPEQMYCLEKGEKNAILGWKSNYFVFGMVILSLMVGSHLNQVYDYSGCYIDRVKIQQMLRNCRQGYPDKLVKLVEKMLQQRPQDRLNFRNLLHQMSFSAEPNQELDLQLLNQKSKPVQVLPVPSVLPNSGYSSYNQPLFKEPQHVNYLNGLVYPKIGRAGQFYNQSKLNTSGQNIVNRDQSNIVAQQRLFYANRNSNYIGDAKSALTSPKSQSPQKLIREGKGYYRNNDGQLYLGQWVKGEMDGYGKLYWDQKSIRYEGDFRNGKFNGRGTEYNAGKKVVGEIQQGDEPDSQFVRLQRNNWQRYQGSFVNDKREGQGIVYFKSGRWMGNFKDGQPNGHGIFTDNNGVQTRGVWKDGVLQ